MADDEAEEEVPKVVAHALTREEVDKGLSTLAKTIDSTSFAFTRFSCPRSGLNKIDLLKTYKHLRYLELHENLLTDLSALEAMTYLLSLNLRKNNLAALKLPKLEFLQVLNVADNKITAIEGLELPMLRFFYASRNVIASVAGLNELGELERVDLEGNQLKTGEGLGLPQIKTIALANNKLVTLEGLADLSAVTVLDLTGNELITLEGIPQSDVLESLNLRGNKLAKPDDVEPLKALRLKSLILAENPVAEVENYRIKIIRRLPKLVTLDEEPVTEEEQEAAREPEEIPPEPEAEDKPPEEEE